MAVVSKILSGKHLSAERGSVWLGVRDLKGKWAGVRFPGEAEKNLIDWTFYLKKSLGHRKIKMLGPHDGVL
jgi:hypothetical protein